MTHDVFISYASKDLNVAQKVRTYLERNQIDCWMAPDSIPAGKDYAVSIVEGIEECKLLVLVLSLHSNTSHNVRNEIELAHKKGLPMIVLRMEEIELEKGLQYYLQRTQWLDFFADSRKTQLEKLVLSVKELLSSVKQTEVIEKGTGTNQPEVTAGKKNQRVLVLSVIFVILIGSAIILFMLNSSPKEAAKSKEEPKVASAASKNSMKTPSVALQGYLEALKKENFKAASGYLADQFLKIVGKNEVSWASEMENNLYKNNFHYTDFKIANIQDYDSTRKMADVILKGTQSGKKTTDEVNISIINEEGKWKIDPDNILSKTNLDLKLSNKSFTFTNFVVIKYTTGMDISFNWMNQSDKNVSLGWVNQAEAIIKTKEGSYTVPLQKELLKKGQSFNYTLSAKDAKGDLESISIQGIYVTDESGLALPGGEPFNLDLPINN